MNKKKYYIGIALMLFVGSLHSIFFECDDKYDVYLFYNHKRYLTNILYDISNLFNLSVLLYFLKQFNKTVFRPLYILSILMWVSYFVFYNQIGDLILIPIYLILIIHQKWKSNQHLGK